MIKTCESARFYTAARAIAPYTKRTPSTVSVQLAKLESLVVESGREEKSV